jgi:hypothetical protein
MDKMTKCKACSKEIAKDVKKCPHCGKDQRNFFMKHKVLSAVLIILILAGIGSAMGKEDKNSIPEPSNTEDIKKTET